MANCINSLALSGRLVRDVECRQAGSTNVLNFSIAVDESVKKGDNWETYPNYIDIVYFIKNPAFLMENLKKGTLVAVQGKLHQDRWEKDGKRGSAVRVKADMIQLCGGSSNGGSKPAASNNQSNDMGAGFPEDLEF